jgi:N-glycosylase/DNA lyase
MGNVCSGAFTCSNVVTFADPISAIHARTFPVRDYDLAATLTSGQAFRWRLEDGWWTGVIGHRCVRLQADASGITAEVAKPVVDWQWLSDYLQLELDLGVVLATFPDDEPMRAAVGACRGLRLLRQEPWECLASFILSSTKQIVQIRQIIAVVCERFGESIPGVGPVRARMFPSAVLLARVSEAELRACKMGFRAPYLLAAARRVASGELELERLRGMTLEDARAALMTLPGVGRKIADCVLLFAYGFAAAFPLDVWVLKALRELYFPRRRAVLSTLQSFAGSHFGPNAGYAQQYLFHYVRTKRPLIPALKRTRSHVVIP